jgi:hypothetical protein
VKPRIFKQGGKRDKRGRVTFFLSEREVMHLAHAILAAKSIGLPLNRMITIHWERSRVKAHDATSATVEYLAKLRGAIGKRGFAYVWIRENDYGDGSKGDHVHILAHIPDGFDIGKKQRARINAITGKRYRAGVIYTVSIGGSKNAARASPDHYHVNLCAVAEYVLKGSTKAVSEALGLWRWGDGGRVVGQRCGKSKNLSRAVQTGQVA